VTTQTDKPKQPTTEYICVSCWTSFDVNPANDNDVVCPHCGFEQPAVDQYLEQDTEQAAPHTPVEEAPDAENGTDAADQEKTDGDRVAEEVIENTTIKADVSDNVEEGLEPISFDNLDDLETLMEEGEKSVEAESEATETTPSTAETSTDEESAGPPTKTPEVPMVIAWQLKGSGGLTYRFTSANGLVAWASQMERPKKCLISIDGAIWKRLNEFLKQLGEDSEPTKAFADTAALAPLSYAPKKDAGGKKENTTRAQSISRARRAATAGSSAKGKGSSERTRSRTSATRTGERSRTSQGGPRRTATSMTGRRSTTTANMRAPRSQDVAGSTHWKTRMVFLSVGLAVGGLGVYIGMYLLGFYELVI